MRQAGKARVAGDKTRKAGRSRTNRHRRSGFGGRILCAEEAEFHRIAEKIFSRLRRGTGRTVRPDAVKPRSGATARRLRPPPPETKISAISLNSASSAHNRDRRHMARRCPLGRHGGCADATCRDSSLMHALVNRIGVNRARPCGVVRQSWRTAAGFPWPRQ